ncbi:matrilin-2-like [Haliotis rubra]|uniref:matrilin-2-like n=1 Tax=Haliotis rubra TaxID=36100 RepID=UPI001EE5DD29|nr:matrilin-2-like [Haliotis rubra]
MTARFVLLFLAVLSLYSAATAKVVHPCKKKPCANGGKCIEKTPTDFYCKCAAGFSGGHCRGSADKCFNKPCRNGAICKNDPNGYTCTCLVGYEGRNCGKKCRQEKLDILLIEDVSSSIPEAQYMAMKDLEVELISYTLIRHNSINVALMTYSGKAEVNFYLNKNKNNKRGAIAAVNAQKQTGGSTFLADAISLAISDVFVEKNGDRPDAENIVILFTDGNSSKKSSIRDPIGELLSEATVIIVTPSSGVLDLSDISNVASAPDEENVLSLSDPLALDEIKKRTIYRKCNVNVALRE